MGIDQQHGPSARLPNMAFVLALEVEPSAANDRVPSDVSGEMMTVSMPSRCLSIGSHKSQRRIACRRREAY